MSSAVWNQLFMLFFVFLWSSVCDEFLQRWTRRAYITNPLYAVTAWVHCDGRIPYEFIGIGFMWSTSQSVVNAWICLDSSNYVAPILFKSRVRCPSFMIQYINFRLQVVETHPKSQNDLQLCLKNRKTIHKIIFHDKNVSILLPDSTRGILNTNKCELSSNK